METIVSETDAGQQLPGERTLLLLCLMPRSSLIVPLKTGSQIAVFATVEIVVSVCL